MTALPATRTEALKLVEKCGHENSSLWLGDPGPGGPSLTSDDLHSLIALARRGADTVGATRRGWTIRISVARTWGRTYKRVSPTATSVRRCLILPEPE